MRRRPMVAALIGALATAPAGCGEEPGESDVEATMPGSHGDSDDEAGTSEPTGGDTASKETSGEPVDPCSRAHPGDQVIRRLSNSEFNNTVYDLFGDVVQSQGALLAYEGDNNGFTNNIALLTVGGPLVKDYLTASETIADDVVAALPTLLPCAANVADPAAGRACAGTFLDEYGLRMYRRPLAPDEREDLLTSYDDALAQGGAFGDGVAFIVMRMLQAPHFLYRVELGGEPVDAAAVRLTPWELASRLSYLLWGSMPDQELFDAAAADALRTPEQLAAQVDRMLANPKARARVRQLHREWLHLGTVGRVHRDDVVYPEFEGLKSMLQEQAERFVEHVVLDDDGSLGALLTAPVAFLNANLAPLYGVDPAAGGLLPDDGDPATDELKLMPLDPTQRAGIFTHGAILAAYAKPAEPAPVLRGKFLLDQLLCQPPAPPPPDVTMMPPAPELGDTTRSRWEALTEAEGTNCKACHQTINPLGHAFGHYDAIGSWMVDEGGAAIDASGAFVSLSITGEFADAIELLNLAADSDVTRACVVRQYFRFAYGRSDGLGQDQCTMNALKQRFTGSDANLRDLLVALTETDAFLYRPTPGGE